MTLKKSKVVFIQSFIKQFRVPFYRHLAELLHGDGIELSILFGQPDRYHSADDDIVTSIPLGKAIRNKYVYYGKHSLVWQPVLRDIHDADLVILQQGNRHLISHLLLARKNRNLLVGLWGHGRNFQSDRQHGWLERFKKGYSLRADHWFAYTEKSARVLEDIGYPSERITVVQNAIDTRELAEAYDSFSPDEVDGLRQKLALPKDAHVAVYCGRFYGLKEMDLTFQCAKRIRRQDENFVFLLIGDGLERAKVESFCKENPLWTRYLGPLYGREKARVFRLASCQIMPGAVGLNLVDSFAMLTPMITRENPKHGPEIAYLKHGVNGLMSPPEEESYSNAVLNYLKDADLGKRLMAGCELSREIYTIENMSSRFAEGIRSTLLMKRSLQTESEKKAVSLPTI